MAQGHRGFARRLALAAGAAALANAAAAAPAGKVAQKVTGPIAVYWMSAQTQTGFGMPAMGGGGGRPSLGSMMGAMMGGGGAHKSLTLQLGSSQSAPQPAAEHLPPPGLQAGASLPLVTPRIEPSKPVTEDETPQVPEQYKKPRGRMLIFWGCGEHARPGQPVVIDFATLGSGQNAAAFAGLMRGLDLRPMRPPSPSRNTTYGDWPNDKSRAQIQPASSLVGEHTVRGNYSPEIHFALDADQDFLGPLNLTTNSRAPGGWGLLGWNLVPNAQAYFASAIGGGQDTVVLWTSSEVQSAAFALPDYIAPADIARLTASHVLMGPATKTCSVPKEVMDATPQALVQLAAYGGEADFVYPPRPQDPHVAWNQQWAVKVRYRSATGGLLGMAMPGMAGGQGADPRTGQPAPGQPPVDPRAERKKAIMKGLGGAFGLPIP